MAGLVPVLLMLAIGCGPSQEPAPSATPSEPTATATLTSVVTNAPTAGPSASPPLATLPAGEYGGHIVALARADVEHFDVHQDVSAALAARGPGVAYSRMLRLRTGAEVDQPSLLLECDLCESWELVSPPDL